LMDTLHFVFIIGMISTNSTVQHGVFTPLYTREQVISRNNQHFSDTAPLSYYRKSQNTNKITTQHNKRKETRSKRRPL
jgi:hypothetical protein